jgi:hypothetical protein
VGFPERKSWFGTMEYILLRQQLKTTYSAMTHYTKTEVT